MDNNVEIKSIIADAIARVKERKQEYEVEFKKKPSSFLDGTIFGMMVVLDILKNDVSIWAEEELKNLNLD